MKYEIVKYQEKEFDLNGFNKETSRLNALNYNIIMNDNFVNNSSIADAIYTLQNHLPTKKIPKINKRLITKTSIDLVLEFYEHLGLKENLEPILTGKHPMFNTIIVKDSDKSSFIGHKEIDKKITFQVGNIGTFYGLINLAHESAHAINGHHSNFSKLLEEQNKIINKYGEESKKFKTFNEKFNKYISILTKPKNDCITEVETLIIEKLFVEFALAKNLISPEDKEIYKQLDINTMRHDVNLFIEEEIIYRTIRQIKEKQHNTNNSLTELEYNQLRNELLKKNLGKNLVNRLNFISKRKKLKKESNNSKKRFRYIVGEIISSVWIDKYLKSNKQEKQKMISNFKSFLLNNEKYNLDSLLNHLFPNENYISTFNKYINLVNNKTQELNQ